jgi:hypothetical protein
MYNNSFISPHKQLKIARAPHATREKHVLGLLAWFPWDLAIAVVRIVISVQNNGFTRLRSKIGNANFEIMGRQCTTSRSPKSTFQCVRIPLA